MPNTPPQFLGRFAMLWGVAVGTLAYVIGDSLSFVDGGESGVWTLFWLSATLIVSFLVFIVGVVLTVLPRTRMFGSGLLISLAIGIIAGSGVCIALASAGV